VKCFDCLDHEKILRSVKSLIDDEGIVNLINLFLIADIRDKKGINYNYSFESKGIAQGASLSPVLLNIYLHSFDVALSTICRTYPLVHYVRYADDILIGVSVTGPTDNPMDDKQVLKFLLDNIQERKLELKIQRYNIGNPFLFLGIRVMINEGGKLNITAPLGRIHHKIRRMVPPGPYSPDREELSKLTPAALRQRKEDHIISFFNRKMVAYLSFYFWCSNSRNLIDSLKRQILERCVENLALFHKTTISSIKKRYGSKLGKAKIPFLHEGKIDLIVTKLKSRRSMREKELKNIDQSFPPGRSSPGGGFSGRAK